MTVTVRTALRDDAASIARVRTQTWRAAYAGLIDDAVLARMDPAAETVARASRWDELHADPRGCELIAEFDGRLAGWAALGPALDADLPDDGQVYAVYALPEFWSRGIGHALLVEAEARLRAVGWTHAHLWVLDGNERAAAFYEAHGWREDGATMVDERRGTDGRVHPMLERRRVRDLGEAIPPR